MSEGREEGACIAQEPFEDSGICVWEWVYIYIYKITW